MMRKVLLAAAALWFVTPAHAQSSKRLATTPNGLIAAARKEGALNLIWSVSLMGGAEVAKQYEDAFNKTYKMNLSFTFTPGAEVARVGNEILSEMQAHQPASSDIFIGAAAQTQPLIEQNLFTPVDWNALAGGAIAGSDSEQDGKALRIQTALSGVSYNTSMMPDPPAKLVDYLDPKWKGKLATTPYAAGFDILAAKDFWGPEKTLDFVRRLSRQVSGLIRCGDVERIADGEFAGLVMDCISNAALLWKERGAPVGYSIPADAAQKRFYYVSVPANSAHPDAAALFSLFLISPQGQAIMWNNVHADLDSAQGSHTAELIAQYENKGVKFPEISIDWWAKHPEINSTKDQMIKILSRK